MWYYISVGEFRPSTKKVCSSDVKHCLISIFVLKMMVKIGVIFMSFSNPTCHFRDTADFTVCTICTLHLLSLLFLTHQNIHQILDQNRRNLRPCSFYAFFGDYVRVHNKTIVLLQHSIHWWRTNKAREGKAWQKAI